MDVVDLIRTNVRLAQRHAKQILADPDTVILDTETTGLGSGARIVDLAVIAKGGTLINTLVNPGIHIPEDASAIHGIFDDDVEKAPTFVDLWPQFEEILRTRVIVIYNAPYDLGVIRGEIARLDEEGPPLQIRVEDALILYTQWYFGGVGRSGKHQTRLVDAHCDAPKCVEESAKHQLTAHRAYVDCQATVRRLRMIADTCWLHDHYRKAKKQ